MKATAVALVLVGWLTSRSADAHDLWLIPPEKSAVGKTLHVHANVGMEFPKSVHGLDPEKFKRRLLIAPDGKELTPASAGIQDLSGVLHFEPKVPGIYQLGIETNPKLITLAAEKFNEYLVSDGLAHIYRLRAQEKILDQPGRERYRKSPKVLIQVGKGEGDFARPLGLPLEIVPLKNPFLLRKGDTLPVRVLFEGKPLPEANLGWQAPGDGDTPRGLVRTNAQGQALVPIEGAGLRTIRLTHMTRPKTDDYEWESFWTTLTFRIPEAE